MLQTGVLTLINASHIAGSSAESYIVKEETDKLHFDHLQYGDVVQTDKGESASVQIVHGGFEECI